MIRKSSSVRLFGVAAFVIASFLGAGAADAQNTGMQRFSMHVAPMQLGAPFSVHIEDAYPNSEWFLAADVAEGKILVPGMPRLVIGLAVTPAFVSFPHWFADPSGKSDLTLVASHDIATIGTPFFGQCYDFDPTHPSGIFASNVEKLVVHPPAAGLGDDRLVVLSDDGSQYVPLPFAFPFFGVAYTGMYVNANGNVTFGAADSSRGGDLSLFAAGLPRIAPMLTDLAPSFGRVSVDETAIAGMAMTVHYETMRDKAAGGSNSFDLTLYSGGHIQIIYGDCAVETAIVGIAPGATLAGASADIGAPGVQLFDLAHPIAQLFNADAPFVLSNDIASYLYFTGFGYVLLR